MPFEHIWAYSQINGRAPAEADFQRYFKVTPPSVHQMLGTLEKIGLIQKQPGVARSIQLLVPPPARPANSGHRTTRHNL
ncbi:hypothetical protein N2A41_28785 (plasmid) [Rhizobium sp. SRDI969]|nr:hypothetical protein N2A41_28785 [Rhizobium leguminosarum bv. viciae]